MYSGGTRIYHLGAKPEHFSARIEVPKSPRGREMRRGFPPPRPTKGLREHRKLPQQGPRAEPQPKTIFVLTRRDRTHLIVMFVVNLMSCQQTYVSPVEVVRVSKLHLLHQSCVSDISRQLCDTDRQLKVFLLRRLNGVSYV